MGNAESLYEEDNTSPKTKKYYKEKCEEIERESLEWADLLHENSKKVEILKTKVDKKNLEVMELRSKLLKYKRETNIEALEGRIKILEMECDELKSKRDKLALAFNRLKKENQEQLNRIESLENVKTLCGICEENPIDCFFTPCNHAYACQNCAQDCQTCPVCRARAGISVLYLKGN